MLLKNLFNNKKVKLILSLLGGSLYFYSMSVFALDPATGGPNIGTMAANVTSTISNIGALVGATAYLAGFGLTIAAIFKFKAHKENPTQVPLGQPMMLLVAGVLLIFLPSLISPAGSTIFGTGATMGGFSGTGITGLK